MDALNFYCPACSAGRDTPCSNPFAGQECDPHMARVDFARRQAAAMQQGYFIVF